MILLIDLTFAISYHQDRWSGFGGMQYTSVCNPLSSAGEFLSNENLCKANLLSVLLASPTLESRSFRQY